MFNGVIRILTNVRFIPKLKRNLISLGSLNLLGYDILKMDILVIKDGKIVMKGKKENDLYTLLGNSISSSTDVVMSDLVLNCGIRGLYILVKEG